MIKMQDIKLTGKRVLIREDLNVPMKDRHISDDSRIRAALPTISRALKAGARVMVMSHLGRPTEGEYDEQYSLLPVARHLAQLLDQPVRLERDWLDGVEVGEGEVVLCENVRFNVGEKANDDGLARRIAALANIYINDAFATAHRAQASTHGVAKYAQLACAGPLLSAELEALGKALDTPEKPLVAIVGGSKVSSKLEVLESLLEKVDQLIVGGGIANTFMKAAGLNIGKSLYEPDLVGVAARLLQRAQDRGASIPLPIDVICGKEFSETTVAVIKPATAVDDTDMIMDVGPQTAEQITALLSTAGTIVWNGPLGVFEFDAFATGTQALARAIAVSPAFSIAGGGDTLAAIAKFGITDQVSYISTGGGAFLEFLEGKTLPAVAILEERARAQPDHTHPSEGY